ncbi:MAG: hypothetical protein KME59_16090 [Trichormus sp. ATA11-4-KO1]|jgi:hypothetical protein|nr:hypothetical protein [Trichormus sp. ATA11-4-KO1]
MNMVDGSTLLTTIFVLVDDWYQQKGYRYVPLYALSQLQYNLKFWLNLSLQIWRNFDNWRCSYLQTENSTNKSE